MSSGRRTVVVALVALVLFGGGWLLVTLLRSAFSSTGGIGAEPECVVQQFNAAGQPLATRALADTTISVVVDPNPAGPVSIDQSLSLTAVQLQHASTINALGLQRGLPERARVIAIATALQESSLRNLSNGDLDSIGLFQQRPSQGWGTAEQISDPVFAAGAFYDALLNVTDWPTLPLTQAAQTVQQSGYPEAYAKWEPAATQLAAALSGLPAHRVNCRDGAVAPTAEGPARADLPGTDAASPRLRSTLAAAQAELGGLTVVEVSADGRSGVLGVAVVGLGGPDGAAVLAEWAVAHATGSSVTSVDVAAQTWSGHAWGAAAVALPDGQLRLTVAAG